MFDSGRHCRLKLMCFLSILAFMTNLQLSDNHINHKASGTLDDGLSWNNFTPSELTSCYRFQVLDGGQMVTTFNDELW